jgi:hypothetical protein
MICVTIGFNSLNVIRFTKKSVSLSVLPHKKGRAGVNYNEAPREKLNRMRELEDKYEDLIEKDLDGVVTGDSLRSKRERDLKVQFASEPKVKKEVDPTTLRKFSPEFVDAIIKCLNSVYKHKEERGLLSDAELAGKLEWADFVAHAEEAGLPAYFAEDQEEKKAMVELERWVTYHRKKGDIKFEVNIPEAHQDRWAWIPRPQYKRNAMRTRQNIRHRKAHGLIPDKKKVF